MHATWVAPVDGLIKFMRQRRNDVGLTQAELAERLTRLGYAAASSTVGGWETENKNPPIDDPKFVTALANVLKTTRVSIYKAAGVLDDSPMVRREALINMIQEFTDAELDEIEDFAEFMLSRRGQRRKE